MSTRPNQATATAVPPEAWQRLLEAAESLLDARADQMVTADEWRALRDAVIACRPGAAPDGVPTRRACPACHEWHPDLLILRDEGTVACQTCGNVYEPAEMAPQPPIGSAGGGDALPT